MPGEGIHKFGAEGDTNIDISQSFCLLYAFVYMILWYNAIIFYPVSEMTYTVSSGTLNPSIPYLLIPTQPSRRPVL